MKLKISRRISKFHFEHIYLLNADEWLFCHLRHSMLVFVICWNFSLRCYSQWYLLFSFLHSYNMYNFHFYILFILFFVLFLFFAFFRFHSSFISFFYVLKRYYHYSVNAISLSDTKPYSLSNSLSDLAFHMKLNAELISSSFRSCSTKIRSHNDY